MSKEKYLVVISGPTASGKTGLSLKLAQWYDTVIVSADSRQFYQEMNIGTAKPTSEELQQATHYFIDSLSITQDYTVGDFEREAMALLEQLFEQKNVVLLVGGSGLFVQAICEGLDPFPEISKEVRETLNTLYQEQGLAVLQEELKRLDPVYYEEVDLQNPKRIIRALEVCRVAGQPFSDFRQQSKKSRPFTPIYLQMNWPRATLYDRINQRVDQMMNQGLLEEVKRLQPYEKLNALQTVGYQEFFPYLREEYTLAEAIELLKRNSRRYAKRQMTWNRRGTHWKHFHPSEIELIKSYLTWTMKGKQTIFWKKSSEGEQQFLVGLKNQDSSFPIFSGENQKKKTILHSATEDLEQIDQESLSFLVHEIRQRYIDQELVWNLPKAWEKIL